MDNTAPILIDLKTLAKLMHHYDTTASEYEHLLNYDFACTHATKQSPWLFKSNFACTHATKQSPWLFKSNPGSNANMVMYDISRKLLFIEFNKGSIYAYKDIPESIYRKLVKAPSFGSYMHHNIKDKYAYYPLKPQNIK